MSHFLMRLGVAFYPGGYGQVLISFISVERIVGADGRLVPRDVLRFTGSTCVRRWEPWRNVAGSLAPTTP